MQEAAQAEVIGTVVEQAPTGLYRFYDVARRLLYVGISDNPGLRWEQHAAADPWWPEVAIKTLDWYPDRRAALDAESTAIGAENPVYNVKRPPAQKMTLRGWYMSREDAERFDGLVAELRSATGRPKYAVLTALVDVIDRHRDEVEAETRAAAK